MGTQLSVEIIQMIALAKSVGYLGKSERIGEILPPLDIWGKTPERIIMIIDHKKKLSCVYVDRCHMPWWLIFAGKLERL